MTAYHASCFVFRTNPCYMYVHKVSWARCAHSSEMSLILPHVRTRILRTEGGVRWSHASHGGDGFQASRPAGIRCGRLAVHVARAASHWRIPEPGVAGAWGSMCSVCTEYAASAQLPAQDLAERMERAKGVSGRLRLCTRGSTGTKSFIEWVSIWGRYMLAEEDLLGNSPLCVECAVSVQRTPSLLPCW